MSNEIDRRGITWFLALVFIPTIALSLILSSMQESFADKLIIYNTWIPAPHNEVGGFTPSHGTAVLVF
jgi:hypothetical protein